MSLKVTWNGAKIAASVSGKCEQAVRAGAHYILDESRKQVPIDTGALSRSGAVDSDGTIAVISYDTPYAVRWHEEQANFQRGERTNTSRIRSTTPQCAPGSSIIARQR